MPERIQRKRTLGWRTQPNTVYVGRGSKWGNPFFIINEEGFPWITDLRQKETMPVCNGEGAKLVGLADENLTWDEAERAVVALFRQQCCDRSRSQHRIIGLNRSTESVYRSLRIRSRIGCNLRLKFGNLSCLCV